MTGYCTPIPKPIPKSGTKAIVKKPEKRRQESGNLQFPKVKTVPKKREKQDEMRMPFQKEKRNEIPRDKQRAYAPYCEICGRGGFNGKTDERHHINTRGAGGGDEPLNTIDVCWDCHYVLIPSGKISKKKLKAIAAEREAYKEEHGLYKWENDVA